MGTAYQILEPEGAEYLSSTFPSLVKNGTNVPVAALAYDAAADEAAFWRLDVSQYSSGNLTVDVFWYADTASANDVVWGASLACITANTDSGDVESKALDTENTVTDSHLGTTGQRLHKATITLSNTDSIAAGDAAWLRLRRVGSSGSDTMTGDALLERVIVSYTTA